MTDKLNALTSNIGILTNYINSCIIKEIHDRKLYLDDPYKFLYTILFKTNNGLDTANLLICKLYSKPHFTDSLFLIIRTLLSDCIIYDYLIRLSKTDEELITNIKRLNYDHIHFTINNLKIYKDAYRKSHTEVESVKDELKQLKNEYFDNSGNPIFQKLEVSVSKAIKYIIVNRQNESIDVSLEAFEYYDKFSKYEHLGDLTFFLTHRPFNIQEQDEVFLDIYNSVNTIIQHIRFFISAWESENFIDFDEFCVLQNNVKDSIK